MTECKGNNSCHPKYFSPFVFNPTFFPLFTFFTSSLDCAALSSLLTLLHHICLYRSKTLTSLKNCPSWFVPKSPASLQKTPIAGGLVSLQWLLALDGLSTLSKSPAQFSVICLSLFHLWLLHNVLFKSPSTPLPIVFSACKIYLVFHWQNPNPLKETLFLVKGAGLDSGTNTSLTPVVPPVFPYILTPYWTMLCSIQIGSSVSHLRNKQTKK